MSAAVWQFRDVEVHEATRELIVAGVPVDIEPRPFDLLLLLLQRAGEVVSTEEIIVNTWAGRIINDAAATNVANAVSKLRKLLRDDDREIIKTVPKIGYRFAVPAQRQLRVRQVLIPTFESGQAIPGRPQWRLTEKLDSGSYGDSWIATHAKTQEQRVFKFCTDRARLAALKREATLFRILRETLGDRAPVPALLEWQFETPPFHTEAERWGQDLHTWAQHKGGLRRLPIDIRLHVLALIAEVVTTVHSVGVLHKDLKPQNILLREEGDGLQVRLCDFGAGALLDTPEVDALPITRMGFTQTVAHVGTPMYAAPELQAGGTPSIQTDVYALGVLLYQLVVGDWRPLAFGWEADVEDELLQHDIAVSIDRDPARRPSSALMIAQWIRALPERREQLAGAREAERKNSALRESLQRERARRPWIVAAALVLLLAIGVSSSLMIQARRAAQVAAEHERTARSVADFLSNDIIRQSLPDYGGRVDISLKAAVLSSIPKIPQRLGGDAPVAAELSQFFAEYLAALGNSVDAANLARETADLYTKLYGATDRRTLSARVDEYRYRVLTETSTTLAPPFRAFEESLAALPDSDPIVLRTAMINVGLALMEGRDEDTVPILQNALARFTGPLSGKDQRALDEARLAYVRYLAHNARYDAAQAEGERLMPHLRARYGARSRLVLDLHRTMGRVYMAPRAQRHDFAAAEVELQTAVDGLTELYGADSSQVARALMDLGDLFITRKRWADAEPIKRRLLMDFERHYGADSIWTWRTRLGLLITLNGLADSNPAYRKPAVDMATELLALTHEKAPELYIHRRTLLVAAYSLIASQRYAEADRVLLEFDTLRARAATADTENLFLDGHENYLRGLLAIHRREQDVAIRLFTAAVEQLTPFGADRPEILDAKARLAALTQR
jgi:eukaryotic-like serine/threonine-protein kinase